MKPRKIGLISAAVAALMAAPMFAATVQADDVCADAFADSPAATYCTAGGFIERKFGNKWTFCLFSVSCSVSFTHGAPVSGDTRSTYDLTADASGIGLEPRHFSDFDVCVSQSTEEDDSVSFSGRVETFGCEAGEFTISQAANGAFNTNE